MSTNECDNVLAKLIDTIVSYEKQSEGIKIELASNERFSPFSTFKRINTSETGFLNDEDLESFFRYYGFSPSKQDLKRLLSLEKQKSSRLTYNDFLSQILPLSNIDLRNDVLERIDNGNIEITESIIRDIGRLITAIYQKEVEYLRMLETDKKRLLKYDVALIDVAFLCLSDDITTFLSYKSISKFMKNNGFQFGKNEHECFMRRIDKSAKGRVSVTDFKYILFPFKSLMEASAYLNGYNFSQTKPTIDGISPIKSLIASPGNKNNISNDSRNQQTSTAQRNPGDSILRKSKNSFSPVRPHEDESIDVKIPAGKGKISQQASQVTFNEERGGGYRSGQNSGQNFYDDQNKNIYQTDQYIITSSRNGFYNQEIAQIQDHLLYQNVPGTSGLAELDANNPLENRFLDPKYHSYWGYSKQHNTTLSPEYLNNGHYNLKSRKLPSQYYNPNFLEHGSHQNSQRYPENPFRHTDHRHYFQNYYNGLRSNYYDQYYNFIPYKTKVAMSRHQSPGNRSQNSPAKSYIDLEEAQARSDFYNQQSGRHLQSQQIPQQENSFRNSPIKQRASSTAPENMRNSNYSASNYKNAPQPEYKLLPQGQAVLYQTDNQQTNNKSAIKIDSQGPQRSSESLIDTFLIQNQPQGDEKHYNPNDEINYVEKPYKYVVVHN